MTHVLTELNTWLEGKEGQYREWAAQVTTRPTAYAGPIGIDNYGCVYTWASRGDDRLAETNYKAFVDELEGLDAWLEEDPDYITPEWETWYDGRARHWLVGALETIIVRVLDDDGNPTPHGVRSYQIHCQLEDYPVLDDDALSALEWEDFEEALEEAVRTIAYRKDDDDHLDAILKRIQELSSNWPEWSAESAWRYAEKTYPQARNDVYEALAQNMLEV